MLLTVLPGLRASTLCSKSRKPHLAARVLVFLASLSLKALGGQAELPRWQCRLRCHRLRGCHLEFSRVLGAACAAKQVFMNEHF